MEITKQQYEQMVASGAQKGITKDRIDASLARKGMSVKGASFMGDMASEAGKGILDIPKAVVQGARVGAEEYQRAGQSFDQGNVGEGIMHTASGVAGAAAKSAGGALGGMARTVFSPVTAGISALGRATGLDKDAELLAKKVASSDTVQGAVKGYQDFKQASPGAAGVLEGAGSVASNLPAIKGAVGLAKKATSGVGALVEKTAAGKVASAEAGAESIANNDALKWFGVALGDKSKGATAAKKTIMKKGGETQGPVQKLVGASTLNEMAHPDNKKIAATVRKYAIEASDRPSAVKTAQEVTAKVDEDRVFGAMNATRPRWFASPDLSLPKLVTPKAIAQIAQETGKTVKEIQKIVKDQTSVLAREMRQEMKDRANEGFGGNLDRAVTRFKNVIKESDPKAFDVDSPEGPARRRIAEEIRARGRDLIKENIADKKVGANYKQLAEDERWLITATENALERGVKEGGAGKSIAQAVVTGSKTPAVLLGVGAAIGGTAGALGGPGTAITGALTGAAIASLIAGGVVSIGGKAYTKSGVRRLIWKEVGSMAEKLQKASPEEQLTLAKEIAAAVVVMQKLNEENGDESAPKDEDID